MRNTELPVICSPKLRSNRKCCMIESPPKSLLEFAFKIYLLFMCVLLKCLAFRSPEHGCTGKAHSTILRTENQIMGREKREEKNDVRDR